MTISKQVLFLATLILAVRSALIYIPGIPVNQMNLYNLQVASDLLQRDLNGTSMTNLQFNNSRRNNFTTYAYSYVTNYFLQLVANDPGIVNFNNVIVGSGSNVVGSKNIIFGNNNNITGSRSYVFSQNFDTSKVKNGSISDSLVLDNWLVELLKIGQIPWGANRAITNVIWLSVFFYNYVMRDLFTEKNT